MVEQTNSNTGRAAKQVIADAGYCTVKDLTDAAEGERVGGVAGQPESRRSTTAGGRSANR